MYVSPIAPVHPDPPRARSSMGHSRLLLPAAQPARSQSSFGAGWASSCQTVLNELDGFTPVFFFRGSPTPPPELRRYGKVKVEGRSPTKPQCAHRLARFPQPLPVPLTPPPGTGSLSLPGAAGAATAGVHDAGAAKINAYGGGAGTGTGTSGEPACGPLCSETDDESDFDDDQKNKTDDDTVPNAANDADGYREVELAIDMQRKDPLGQRYGGPWRLVKPPTPEVAAPAQEAAVPKGCEGWNPFEAVADDRAHLDVFPAPAPDRQLEQLLRDLDALIEIDGRSRVCHDAVHFSQPRANGLRRLVVGRPGVRRQATVRDLGE